MYQEKVLKCTYLKSMICRQHLRNRGLFPCLNSPIQAGKGWQDSMQLSKPKAGIVFRDIQPKLFNWLPRGTGPPTGLSGQMKEINTEI